MKRLIRRAAFVAFLCLTVTAPRAGVAKVLVFAASSTTNVIEDLNRLFAERGKGRALGSFGSSGIMARQIENGAPADIYLTADVKWINYLVGKALVTAGSKNDLFHNRLALIAPARRPFRLRIRYGFALYDRLGDSPLAIADPQHSPAGRYARMALETLGVWKPLTKRTARTNNVREALALVERGEAAAGIVYATDAKISRRVRLVALFPEATHPAIGYRAAIVRGRETPEVRRYFTFLSSKEAAKIFRRHGFLVK